MANFVEVGDIKINLDNITYVEKRVMDGKEYVEVHFVGEADSLRWIPDEHREAFLKSLDAKLIGAPDSEASGVSTFPNIWK